MFVVCIITKKGLHFPADVKVPLVQLISKAAPKRGKRKQLMCISWNE